MTTTLKGATALVTGGGSGIGLACARRLAEDGATVTICGRTEARLDEAAASISEGCRRIVADISDDDATGAAVAYAAEPTGVLDIVVANAGGARAIGPLALTTTHAFQQDLTVNVTGTYLTIRHAVP